MIEFAEAFVRNRPALRMRRDRFGNRLIELRGRARGSQRLVLVAHMDHPGLIARRMANPRTLEADFLGGVAPHYVKGSRVRFFDAAREIPGRVITCRPSKTPSSRPTRCTVRVAVSVAPGSLGMFDITPGRVTRNKFYGRVCDDLAGAAAALEALDQLASAPPRAAVALLLTRAEEVGFIGAIAAATRSRLLHRSDRLISIECSSIQPYAPQGAGVILRVGDRTSIFNSSLMYFLSEQATALARRNESFRFQRLLMPGGSCEGTVFDACGFVTGAVCVALGNYHNMDRARKKVAPEYIDTSDWTNMVRLLVQIAREFHEFQPGLATLRKRIDKRYRRFERVLVRSVDAVR